MAVPVPEEKDSFVVGHTGEPAKPRCEILAFTFEFVLLSSIKFEKPLSICQVHAFHLRAAPAPERKGIVIGKKLIVDTNDLEAV